MSEVIANFSGAEQVIPGGQPKGAQQVALSDLFRSLVLESKTKAWYVDHFTEHGERYNIFYLTVTTKGPNEPQIRWTHENLAERGNGTPDETWGPDDVADWFVQKEEDGTKRDYEHVVDFHSASVAHRLHIAKYNVTLDGEDRWAEYVELGVKGAIGDLTETFEHLDSIEVRRL